MFKYPEFSEELLKLAMEAEYALEPAYEQIDNICEENQYKVLNAFRKERVAEAHFNSSSGYGYNEIGRECLEAVYADIFHAEDALVRAQITCGTHAIYLGLSSNLLPGDELLFVSGKPYDSLEKSIGITTSPMSLAEYGVTYKAVELLGGQYFDFEGIERSINKKTKIVAIQRSKGYTTRDSLSCESIGEVVRLVKSRYPDVIVFVDNCYGEFVEAQEPTDVGADLCAGSLIKNPGGGLAPIGGYLVGKADLIERCAYKLTAPGLGKEVGSTLGALKSFFQGLSIAPKVVAEALKNAHFLAAMYEYYGYTTFPRSCDTHHCIVQAVNLLSAEKVEKFCRAIQAASYVDSFVRPEGWDMPGYHDSVIMASGSFVSGSSIELSADGPLRPPYTVFFQGGLTHEQGRYAILSALKETENL